ncbi:MAG: hexose kinase, partial [Chloroflexia bacterium]|nr:hexose kinase [Chloroflexia bacterium]
ILVVNPNPAVDRVAVVDYREGASLRPARFSLWAGGSGVHAAYVAHLLGGEVLVQGFIGGHSGARFRELVTAQGLAADLVEIDGETRGTYSLLDRERGDLCNVAEPGPAVTGPEERALEERVLRRLPDADLMIVSGSVPPGCAIDFPARLVAAAHRADVPCIADLAGDALLAAIPSRPWLIKPSRVEIGELLGIVTVELDAIVPLATEWLAAGVANACVSLDAEGLLWASGEGVRHISAPRVPSYNSIGCGDTLVGALAVRYAQTSDLAGSLRAGVAAAAANIAYDAPGYCTAADIDRLLPGVHMQQLTLP